MKFKEHTLREELVDLLRGEQAHANVKRALAGIKPDIINIRPGTGLHSVWELFEHMRIAQEDILRYSLDASWISPDWSDGFWPENIEVLTEEMWSSSTTSFFADLNELITLVQDPNLDLLTNIPHGGGHTYLREILLVADHNAYHVGQIIRTRKSLGDWTKENESTI
ncbi:MAG: DinB family protein [Candidatus Anammoxibacter sp.]